MNSTRRDKTLAAGSQQSFDHFKRYIFKPKHQLARALLTLGYAKRRVYIRSVRLVRVSTEAAPYPNGQESFNNPSHTHSSVTKRPTLWLPSFTPTHPPRPAALLLVPLHLRLPPHLLLFVHCSSPLKKGVCFAETATALITLNSMEGDVIVHVRNITNE